MLRIGSVPFLVARPLTDGLAEHPDVQLTVAPPSELAEGLSTGALDIALASSILSLQNEALTLWHGGPVIASRGAVRSVLLFLRPGINSAEDVRTVVLDPFSRTGAALAKALLKRRFEASFATVPCAPDADPFACGSDAVQLIGDRALSARRAHSDWSVVDLGDAWFRWTGQPFIFAGWTARAGFDPEAAAEILTTAARTGMQKLDELAAAAASETGQTPAELEEYLRESVLYRLAPAELETALAAFRRELIACGLLGGELTLTKARAKKPS